MSETKGKRPERDDTFRALTEQKRGRGRPKHKTPRQSVYVELSKPHKSLISQLADQLPDNFARADIPDMAVATLNIRFDSIRRAVASRDREIPEGITDLASLHYLWDLELPDPNAETKWTSVRLSPQYVVELGRLQGTLNALFGANRSDVFLLGLFLLQKEVETKEWRVSSAENYEDHLRTIYL